MGAVTVKGTAFLDVTVELLEQCSVLDLLPRAFRVIGTADSIAPGTVRLVVESEELSGRGHVVTLQVSDVGCTRTAIVVPVHVNREQS